MSTPTDNENLEYRRFTKEEFQTMLSEGIVSLDEDAILHDGFVSVPAASSGALAPNPDPGPADAAVPPQDIVLAEPQARPGRVDLPNRSRILEAAPEIMNTLVQKPRAAGVRRKFTVDEYYRMVEVGILSPDERTELLEGEIIVMAAIGSKHAFCVDYFNDQFTIPAVKEHALVRVQNPVRFNGGTEVQPDIALVRRTSYADSHPRPEDVLLLIEVADPTIGQDRRHKLPLYARLSIPEAWLADVNRKTVFVNTEPVNGAYAILTPVSMDGTLSPTAFPDVVIAVRDVFPW